MDSFLNYLTLPYLWEGLLLTLKLAVLGFAGGFLLGLVIAPARESQFRFLRWPAAVYVWVFRGTPTLLQLIFFFYLFPTIGWELSAINTAIVTFWLHEAAYLSEIFRGGIKSVPKTQKLAAAALGMGGILTLWRVVFPQAMRAMIPNLSNQAVNVIKLTAQASVIAVAELTLRTQQISASSLEFVPIFAVAAALYLFATSAVSIAQAVLEKKYSLDVTRRSRLRPKTVVLRQFVRRRWPSVGSSRSARAPSGTDPDGVVRSARGAVSEGRAGDVVCTDVRKKYGDVTVLDDVNLTARCGEVLVVIGRSGSGKSTLLRLINHLEHVDGGEITVNGSYVGYRKTDEGELVPTRGLHRERHQAGVGMMFQDFNLFENLTLLENVMEAQMTVADVPPKEAASRARELLGRVGLGDFHDSLPHQLSGGQKQRGTIARTLAMNPSIILFDEPTSALDRELVGEVLATMKELAATGITMIVVTHELGFARDVADQVAVMEDGRVVAVGPPGEILGDSAVPCN